MAEPVGVPEAWVAIERLATIEVGIGFALAQRLARRYYPPEQAAQALATGGRIAGDWAAIVLDPTRIHSAAPD